MTRKKRTDKIFFRYYEIPRDSYVLALFGKSGTGNMVRKEKAFISITIWRWVTVIKGRGSSSWRTEIIPIFPRPLR